MSWVDRHSDSFREGRHDFERGGHFGYDREIYRDPFGGERAECYTAGFNEAKREEERREERRLEEQQEEARQEKMQAERAEEERQQEEEQRRQELEYYGSLPEEPEPTESAPADAAKQENKP